MEEKTKSYREGHGRDSNPVEEIAARDPQSLALVAIYAAVTSPRPWLELRVDKT